MKKIISILLALTLALSLCTTAWADEGSTPTPTSANVAQIGETGYTTLEDAIANAGAGATITVLLNTGIGSNNQINKNLTLDLNGCTVTVTTTGTQNAFEVTNGATFTIKDSKGNGKLDLDKFGITLMNSNITIESGEIEVHSQHPGAAVVVAAVGDCTVTMTGGKVVSNNSACFNAGYMGTQTFNISGGTLESKESSTALMGISNSFGISQTIVRISGTTEILMKDAAGKANKLVSDASQNDVIEVTGAIADTDVSQYIPTGTDTPMAEAATAGSAAYVIGGSNIASAANNGSNVTIIKGGTITGINDNVTVTIAAGAGDVTINDTLIKNSNENVTFTVPAQQPEQPEQPDPTHTNRRYPAANTTTTPTETKKDDAISSAKTFDAGVALYVGMALTSVTGMAWVGKKRGL